MIVMTTGLTGLMTLMRQDAKADPQPQSLAIRRLPGLGGAAPNASVRRPTRR